MKTIAITTGDPAGVGPEIVRKSIRYYPLHPEINYIIYGDGFLPPGFNFIRSDRELDGSHHDRSKIRIIDNPGQISDRCQLYTIIIPSTGVQPGKPDKNAGRSAYQILQRVVKDIKEYEMEALVTSPVSKKSIREYDPEFIGHTEFLAREFSTSNFVMNFISEKFDVALLTTHTSLQTVTNQIKQELIIPKMRLIYHFAQKRYQNARVALLGLNPHCGEEGVFGTEEIVLKNAINQLRKEGITIDGPFPADSFFRYKIHDYRQVIACYHDQGLIPFKMSAGEEGVNVTLGLPFFRASVDHGTGYDIAGKGIASQKSLNSALDLTGKIITLD